VTGSFDGHIVQGHIDNTIKVVSIFEEADSKIIKFKTDHLDGKYLIKKGFVAVDGVSLTIVDCGHDWFSIALIPHTSKHTTLGQLKVGDTTNLELDLFAKYAEKFSTS
jgi:riboflavin synthase